MLMSLGHGVVATEGLGWYENAPSRDALIQACGEVRDAGPDGRPDALNSNEYQLLEEICTMQADIEWAAGKYWQVRRVDKIGNLQGISLDAACTNASAVFHYWFRNRTPMQSSLGLLRLLLVLASHYGLYDNYKAFYTDTTRKTAPGATKPNPLTTSHGAHFMGQFMGFYLGYWDKTNPYAYWKRRIFG